MNVLQKIWQGGRREGDDTGGLHEEFQPQAVYNYNHINEIKGFEIICWLCLWKTSVDLQKVKRLKYILLCKPHRDNIHPPMVHMLDIVHDHTPMQTHHI